MVRNRIPRDRKIGSTSSTKMKEAVRQVIEEGKSIRTVSLSSEIKFSTLRRYVEKAKKSGLEVIAYAPNYNCRLVFTHEEEIMLKDYLVKASRIHFGLTRNQIKKLAYEFADHNKKSVPQSWKENLIAGDDWLSGFMSRFHDLSLRRPEATSLSRATSFNKTNVAEFFKNLEQIFRKHSFNPNDIYNADETGCCTVQKVGSLKVIACKKNRQVGKITSAERGTLVTMLGAVNAVGNSIPPFMVFPRVNFKNLMLHGAPPGSVGTAHQSGWMTTDSFYLFMQHFISSTKCSNEHPVLLILDNHETHLSIKTIDLAKENGVVMLTLPPHCSHKLQPLDRTVYGPFKSAYNQAANSFMVNHPGQPITIYDISSLVGIACPLAFTPQNIVAGFQCTGISPFNPGVFSDEDFLCAYVTDRPQCESEIADICVPDNTETPTLTPEPSTSTLKKTPEEISPFPKAPPRKNKGGRKKGNTLILTDTPVKERIRQAEIDKAMKKIKAKPKPICPNSTVASKKACRKIDYTASSSSDEAEDLPLLCDDSTDFSEIGETDEVDNEITIPLQHELVPDDYVLVKFATKKTLVMFVGKITSAENSEDMGEKIFEITFLRREKSSSFSFIFPTVEDIAEVSFHDIVGKLPRPLHHGGTARVARHLIFPVDLEAYADALR